VSRSRKESQHAGAFNVYEEKALHRAEISLFFISVTSFKLKSTSIVALVRHLIFHIFFCICPFENICYDVICELDAKMY